MDHMPLQNLIDLFKFVLFPECDNPEVELLVSVKRQAFSHGCKTCGFYGVLQSNHHHDL